MKLRHKLRNFYFTAIFSAVFAGVGFGYNTWRMEITEDNSNIRTAAFEVLLVLADFEQVIYSAHYDQDPVAGNPRTGWIKVGLAKDLSPLVSETLEIKTKQLSELWMTNWPKINESRKATDELVDALTEVRDEIKLTLKTLD